MTRTAQRVRFMCDAVWMTSVVGVGLGCRPGCFRVKGLGFRVLGVGTVVEGRHEADAGTTSLVKYCIKMLLTSY